MLRKSLLLAGGLCLFFNILSGQTKSSTPNIIYFLSDDLGYGETGIYGQEKIKTPNIDALAKSGMLFTQHYFTLNYH